jgi:molybdopterin biosynthesis enzyme
VPVAKFDERAYIEIVEAVAIGQNVEQQGALATIGATLVPAGTQLAARHIGLLAIAAVIMVEHTETRDDDAATVIEVRRAAAAGQFIAFAGNDLARGETVLRAGQVLTSREIGMLAAVGCAAVEVWRRPLVAIISTGDEIVAPATQSGIAIAPCSRTRSRETR